MVRGTFEVGPVKPVARTLEALLAAFAEIVPKSAPTHFPNGETMEYVPAMSDTEFQQNGVDLSGESPDALLEALESGVEYFQVALTHQFGSLRPAVYTDSPPYARLSYRWSKLTFSVEVEERKTIYALKRAFEQILAEVQVPVAELPPAPKPRIFIGHGRSKDYLEVQGLLTGKWGLECETYETGDRAGHAIRDILETMMRSSQFAVIVMTAEDVRVAETTDGDETIRAESMVPRLNVVHEAGLFQGHLGFSKVVVLKEDETNLLTNLDGIQYIPFDKGKITTAMLEVIGAIRREFPGAFDQLTPGS